VLDSVEHGNQRYTIVRRGKAVAHLEPINKGRGSEVKEVLRRHRPDSGWAEELSHIRGLVEIDNRS